MFKLKIPVRRSRTLVDGIIGITILESSCLVTLPIEMPANVWGARETDKDAGMSIRVVKQYDIDADEEIIRMDILYGTKTLYPEFAVRLWG